MSHQHVFHYFMSLLVSTTMALSLPVHAKVDSPASVNTGSDMEVRPVVYQAFRSLDRNGQMQESEIMIAPVAQAEQDKELSDLVRKNPDNTVVLVAGPNDPGMKTVAKTGFLKRVKIFVTNTLRTSPMMQVGTITTKAKTAVLNKLDKITQFAKQEKAGLLVSLWSSGMYGGMNFYATGDVETAIKTALPLYLLSAVATTAPAVWGRMLDIAGANPGVKFGSAVARLFGIELGERGKRIWETVGLFTVTLAINSAQALFVRWMMSDTHNTGDPFLNAVLNLTDAVNNGFQNSYPIWDAVMLDAAKKNKDGVQRVSDATTKKYFLGAAFIGPILEVLSMMGSSKREAIFGSQIANGMEYIPAALMVITGVGIALYAANPSTFNPAKSKRLHMVMKAGMARVGTAEERKLYVQRRIDRIKAKLASYKKSCVELLGEASPRTASFYYMGNGIARGPSFPQLAGGN